jgi:benzoate-CoA ligase family protein
VSKPARSGELHNVSDLVSRQVAAGRGQARAIVAEDATLSYEELRRQINRAGNLLRELGVRREQRVLLILDDTTVFPIVFLGAIRIGAVPIPVSHLDKDENYRHFVEDSYAELVVLDAPLLDRVRGALRDLSVRWLAKDGNGPGVIDLAAGLAAQSDELDPVATHRDDMAFWLYSSGSTGKPKGVVHLQHDVEVTCENYAQGVLGLRADDVTFSTTKLFHAYGLGNGLSFPLSVGATAVYMAGPTKPAPILELLGRHHPSVLFSVPALFAALGDEDRAHEVLDSVRVCVSAAEPLPAGTTQRWVEQFGLEIVDGIGSTEMLHIYCSNRPGRIRPGTTGSPVPGYELRLVDDVGSEVEGPAVGTLQVRGDSCAAFYWHQHEKTKASMLGSWFATGDRFQRDDDGTYAYVGRVDDMLKVGGLWVSPVDMEHVLLEHPRVAGVGVVGVTAGDVSRVAAYVECVGDPGDEELADDLRAWCKGRLRRYEYPHIVTFVDDLPRTLTGKVQRFRLRGWAQTDAANPDAIVTTAALRAKTL